MSNAVGAFPRLSLFILRTMAALKRKRLSAIPRMLTNYHQDFHGDPLHVCFVCGPNNERGLKLEFFHTDQGGIGCKWLPTPGLESFPGILHGGVSATLLDEIGGVALQSEKHLFALTVASDFKYHAPVISDKLVQGHAKIIARYQRYVLVDAHLFDESGRILTSMSALYFIPPKKLFRRLTRIEQMSPAVESYVSE